MSKLLWKSLLISPAFLGATLAIAASATVAAESQTTAQVAEQASNVIPSLEAQTNVGAIALNPLAEDNKAAALSNPLMAELEQSVSAALEQPVQGAVRPPEIRVAQSVSPAGSSPASNSNNVLQQIMQYGSEGSNSTGQVTSVAQLRDVQPTDWAYQALQSLVERYGCIEGYPDRTYRGNRALTRYEFAAGLNACLNVINELIAAATADLPGRDDLAIIQRLVEEFQAELATLRGRVDALEARVAQVEARQFSTTTKLKGEAIFALTDSFGGGSFDGRGDDNTTVFQNRVRLEFQTSFSGRDVLHTRLAAGNAVPLQSPGGTFEVWQQFNVGNSPNFDNDVYLDWLAYEFPIFGNSRGYLAAVGGIWSDVAPTNNPYFEDFDGGNGALSTFAQQNPIYRIGGGAGGALNLAIGRGGSVFRPTSLTVGYLAGPGQNLPFEKFGVHDGDYAALGQLNFSLGDNFGFALTYVHGYHNTGSAIFDLGGSAAGSNPQGGVVGTSLANFPSSVAGFNRPVVTNSYGVSGALRISRNFSLSAFGSYTDAIILGRGGAEIWTYGAGIALPNFGRQGNVLGLFGGVQPYLADLDVPGGRRRFNNDLPIHAEAFYKFQVTDNISVTPGVIWLLAPNQTDRNDEVWIGTLRTTFSF